MFVGMSEICLELSSSPKIK